MKIPYTLKLICKYKFSYLKLLFFYGIIVKLTNWLTFGQYKKLYGNFHFKDNCDSFPVEGLGNYTGIIAGMIVYFLNTIHEDKKRLRVLLAGEENKVKKVYREKLGFKKVFTAGLSNTDFFWNFENNPPKDIGKFDVIVSQAILEHLLNPYKHISDLSRLLNKRGFLVVRTNMPGFSYHRCPIDCFRFFPDWFEEIAQRLDMEVVDKAIHNAQITYKFRKK